MTSQRVPSESDDPNQPQEALHALTCQINHHHPEWGKVPLTPMWYVWHDCPLKRTWWTALLPIYVWLRGGKEEAPTFCRISKGWSRDSVTGIWTSPFQHCILHVPQKILSSNNYDWPTVVANIIKAWKTWMILLHIMGWEGVYVNTFRIFSN